MKSIPQQRNYFIAFCIVSLILTFSIYLQQKGLVPCPLCLLQRFVMGFLGIFFLIGVACTIKFCRVTTGLVCAVFSILGMLFAGRQIWLQHVPGSASSNCEASLQYMLQTFPLLDVISNVFKGSASCGEVSWQFLHLSLAEWSFLFFMLFFLFSLWQLRKG